MSPSNAPDLYTLILGMSNEQGRSAVMLAEIKDNVESIKLTQASQIVQITQLTSRFDAMQTDLKDVSERVTKNDLRIKSIEEREIERRGYLKVITWAWPMVTGLVLWTVSNLKSILSFIGFSHGGIQ